MAGQVRQISGTSSGRGADDQNDQNVNNTNTEKTSSDRSSGHVTEIQSEDFIKIG